MRDATRTTAAVLDLLDAVYEAPYDPRWWRRVGELLVPLFESDCAVLISHDRRLRTADFAFAEGVSPAATRAYAEHFHRADTWPAARAGERRGLARRGDGDTVPPCMDAQVSREAGSRERPRDRNFDPTAFYHDFWRHHGDLFYSMGGFAPVDDHVIGNIGLPRARQRGPYLATALELLDRVSPHIYRALRLSRQLARADFTDAVMSATPVSQSLAAYVINDARRVVFANARGEQLLRLADGLVVRKAQLAAALAADQARFDAVVDTALRAPDASAQDGPGELDLRRPHARAPLRLTIAPAPIRMLGWLGQGARGALILAHVVEPPAIIPAKAVQRVLALTQAEARVVAALVSGSSPREIAERFAVALDTVRAQIKSAMRRLECHRQAQLTAKVLAALGRAEIR